MGPTRIRFVITPLLSAWHCGPNIGFGWGWGWGRGELMCPIGFYEGRRTFYPPPPPPPHQPFFCQIYSDVLNRLFRKGVGHFSLPLPPPPPPRLLFLPPSLSSVRFTIMSSRSTYNYKALSITYLLINCFLLWPKLNSITAVGLLTIYIYISPSKSIK